MNRSDLQILSEKRIKEAKILIDNGCYDGAYYLAGYAIECALKACIAKEIRQYDFPNKEFAKSVYTHDLSELLTLTSLKPFLERDTQANRYLKINWETVKGWKEISRYEDKKEQDAKDLFQAITENENGILSWLKNYW